MCKKLTWQAKIYLLIVNLVGLSITIYAFGNIDNNIVYTIILWIIIATPFEIRPIQVSANSQATLSFAIHLALSIIYGQWVAIIVATVVTALTDLYGKKGLIKLSFNISQFSITLYLTGSVFGYLKQSNLFFSLPDDLIGFTCASMLYILANNLLVATIIALTQEKSVLYMIKRDLRMTVLYYTALAPMSMLMVLLYKEQPLTMILMIPPLALADTSFRNYISLKNETRKTLEILADFVDRRDQYTAEHSKRVARYADAIAVEMGLDDDEKELIELAGMVHDLGKISISDHILLKKGPLTDAEMKIMQTHPDVAYNILKKLEMYRTGAVIVRAHHERYDGNGYPLGLKDTEIHIGARIMAVADAFDSMTSDRPYRKAMTQEEALNELKKHSGKQFDPDVVEAFLRVLAVDKKLLEVS
ncbi:MAG: HD-GYP domain-containing protein [Bacillota bacterium]